MSSESYLPLQTPTLSVFVTEGGNVLGRKAGLWYTKANV
jgi:hypothetical protein